MISSKGAILRSLSPGSQSSWKIWERVLGNQSHGNEIKSQTICENAPRAASVLMARAFHRHVALVMDHIMKSASLIASTQECFLPAICFSGPPLVWTSGSRKTISKAFTTCRKHCKTLGILMDYRNHSHSTLTWRPLCDFSSSICHLPTGNPLFFYWNLINLHELDYTEIESVKGRSAEYEPNPFRVFWFARSQLNIKTFITRE